MTVQGQIFDNQTKQGIPGASVTIVNSAGSAQGGGVSADSNGIFALTSPILDQGGQLLISSVGYASAMVSPSVIASTGVIGLDENASNLPAAVVTPGSGTSTNYVPYVLGGGALLLLLTGKKKRGGAVGDAAGTGLTLGIVAALGLGAYFLYQKFLGPSAAAAATAANNASAASQTQTANAATQTAIQQTGQNPTLSAATISGLVNTITTNLTVTNPSNYPLDSPPSTGIFSNLFTGANNWTANADAIVQAVDSCNNTADWVALQVAFGTKQLLNNQSVNLITALSLALSPAIKANLNSFFSEQGIMDGTGAASQTIP